jgi:glycosyltransferase involved in cell wall biosynthesis
VTLRGANIVYLAAIDWDFNWQPTQEVASGLRAAGNRVLYVENTGVRPPRLRDVARLRARVSNWRRSHGAAATTKAGVDVLSPLVIPLPYSKLALPLNTRILMRSIRRWVDEDRGRPLIVVTFLPTPLAASVIEELKPAMTIFYSADRLFESSPSAKKLIPFEHEMFGRSDLVLTTSTALRDDAKPWSSNVKLFNHGVRWNDFAAAHATARQKQNATPVVGFAGSIRDELDMALLENVVRAAPDLRFVFAGPVFSDVRALAALPNVELTGPKPHSEIVRMMVEQFHVGILPYTLNRFTEAIAPAKMLEYIAAGLPVVATGLPDIRQFAHDHDGMIEIASDTDAFVDALRRAVLRRSSDMHERRLACAKANAWPVRMEQLSRWIVEHFDARGLGNVAAFAEAHDPELRVAVRR